MPQIRPYRSQISPGGLPGGRSASAADFGAEIGQATAQLGQTVGQVADKIIDTQNRADVSNVHTLLSAARSEWTVHLRERADAAELGDPNFATKFDSDISEYMAKAREGVKTAAGQRAFDEMSAQVRGELTERAGLFQAQSAGAKAKQDYTSALDAARNTLLSDPTQFQQVLAQSLAALKDPAGQFARLPAAARTELEVQTQQTIAVSYFQGLIQNGAPELAQRKLLGGEADALLDADNKSALMKDAEIGIRAKGTEAERTRLELKRAKEEAQEVTLQSFMPKLADGSLSTTEVLRSNLDATGEGSKEHFLALIERRAKERAEKPIKTDPGVMRRIYEDITDGKISTRGPIDRAYLNEKLSNTDRDWLEKQMIEFRSPEGQRLGKKRADMIAGVRPQIDHANLLLGKLDPTGAEAVYRYSHYVDEQVEAYRAAGKDPWELLDPDNPAYLGKPNIVQSFRKSAGASMQYIKEGMAAPKPLPPNKQRLPGETPAQWKARTGG